MDCLLDTGFFGAIMDCQSDMLVLGSCTIQTCTGNSNTGQRECINCFTAEFRDNRLFYTTNNWQSGW